MVRVRGAHIKKVVGNFDEWKEVKKTIFRSGKPYGMGGLIREDDEIKRLEVRKKRLS